MSEDDVGNDNMVNHDGAVAAGDIDDEVSHQLAESLSFDSAMPKRVPDVRVQGLCVDSGLETSISSEVLCLPTSTHLSVLFLTSPSHSPTILEL